MAQLPETISENKKSITRKMSSLKMLNDNEALFPNAQVAQYRKICHMCFNECTMTY